MLLRLWNVIARDRLLQGEGIRLRSAVKGEMDKRTSSVIKKNRAIELFTLLQQTRAALLKNAHPRLAMEHFVLNA
jgi:hypothetical protein